MDKSNIFKAIIAKLEDELATMIEAAQSSRDAATNEESKAENKYDTRGLEASYLAGAQAKRATEIQDLILLYKGTDILNFDKTTPSGITALVEAMEDDETKFYFIAPKEGGLMVEVNGKSIFVISPNSPIGKALIGRKVGEFAELEIKGNVREFEITNIW